MVDHFSGIPLSPSVFSHPLLRAHISQYTSEEGIILYSVSAESHVSSIIIFASSVLSVLMRRIGAFMMPESG